MHPFFGVPPVDGILSVGDPRISLLINTDGCGAAVAERRPFSRLVPLVDRVSLVVSGDTERENFTIGADRDISRLDIALLLPAAFNLPVDI